MGPTLLRGGGSNTTSTRLESALFAAAAAAKEMKIKFVGPRAFVYLLNARALFDWSPM